MRDQIAALGTLQQLDIELKIIEGKLEKYPQEISRYSEELNFAKNSIAEAKEELEKINRIKSELEQKLEQNLDTIKKGENRLFEIKTYKEYEALQKEISETKIANTSLEEQIIQLMEEIENLETLVEEKVLELTDKEKEYGKIINDYKMKISELELSYQAKMQDKEKVTSLINPEILPMYEKIKTKNGIAIAPARNEVCTGCNMNIPPQLFNEVLTLSRMIQCPNCGRILYSEDTIIGEFQTA